MKEKLNFFKDSVLNFIKERKFYCIIGAAILLVLLTIILICAYAPKSVNNFSGNLINNGFALKIGNKIYYLKQDGIYKTNSDGDKKDRIFEGTTLYLNSDGKYLYFVEHTNGKYNLVKMKNNGKNKNIMLEDIDNKMITVEDKWIYYMQDDVFYKIKTNGKDKMKILSKDIETYQIDGDDIYFTYRNNVDCIIAKIKTNGTEIMELENDCNSNFYVKGNKLYYIKEVYNSEKYEYEYTLCQMKVNGEKKQEIIKLPNTIKQINMLDDGIYYLTTEDYTKYELYKMDYKGKNINKITETGFNTKINVINKDVYYMDLTDGVNVNIYKINIKSANTIEL